ncbi:MAG: diacylglycerol kinase [Proteobacteria bacterium]|nr:diacylglycerol kinase [Pseudomonadota bacterium]
MAKVGGAQKQGGFRRLVKSFGYSYSGLRDSITHSPAIRQVLGAVAVLVPLSVLLPVGTLEHLILVLSMMLVALVEFVN